MATYNNSHADANDNIIDLRSIQDYHYAVHVLPKNKPSIPPHMWGKGVIVIKNRHGVIECPLLINQCAKLYNGEGERSSNRLRVSLLYYVATALNYLRERGIEATKATVKDVFDFFDSYIHSPVKEGTDTYRQADACERCIYAVSHFFANMAKYVPECKTDANQILMYQEVVSESGQRRMQYLPYYRSLPHAGRRRSLVRDLCDETFDIMLDESRKHDPMLTFMMHMQMRAGLRGGEVVNIIQENSPIMNNACISYFYREGLITDITIDIAQDRILRSDGVKTGNIKKNRVVHVYPKYFEEFHRAYEDHKRLLKSYEDKMEQEYMPMFLCETGKAMTCKTYYTRLNDLVHKYVVPRLLNSNDPRLQVDGNALLMHNIGMHIFRHKFSVALVMDGVTQETLMFYRGDRGKNSAEPYLIGKRAIIDQTAVYKDAAIRAGMERGRK